MSEYKLGEREVQVRVEQRHIGDNPMFWNPQHCPVALALRELFPGEKICVGVATATIGDTYYLLPVVASNWMRRGYARFAVEPIAFTMTRW